MSDTTFRVQLDELAALAARLNELANSFGEIDETNDFSEALVGDRTALSGLHDFTEGWKDGRKRIKGRSLDAAELLKHAAADYQAAEDGLLESMGVSTTGESL